MASEEERAKILAEYMAAGAEEDDDEVDFDPSDGEFSGDDSSDDDDDDDGEPDPVVLNGSMYLNDEGRIIYSGTWALQSQLIEEDKDILGTKVYKKHPKFKLKSQRRYQNTNSTTSQQQPAMSNNNELFDLERPTLSKLPRPTAEAAEEPHLPTRRTICFDGFFIQPPVDGSNNGEDGTPQAGNGDGTQQHSPQGKKIKERDIEIFITTKNNNNDNNTVFDIDDGRLYHVSGRGYNEYGPFVLDGTYTLSNKPDGSGTTKVRVKCNKTYGMGGGEAKTTTRSGGTAVAAGGKRSRRHNNDDDDSFDDDFGDEKADYGEVNELCEDAGLSIEELRRKYYGGGGGGGDDENEKDGDGGGKISAVKRVRLEESDDDECGF